MAVNSGLSDTVLKTTIKDYDNYSQEFNSKKREAGDTIKNYEYTARPN